MSWDGSATLHDIDFKPENFLDINSYQFRASDEIRWYGIENGWRLSGGSLESNIAYLMTDMRFMRTITPRLIARMRWENEEFFTPRATERPLLELELQPVVRPISFSLLGAPAYAKREAELGLAVSLGLRPWDYLRISWLSPDHYYNKKNGFDDSYYRRAPRQLGVEGAYRWGERYTLRLDWHDNEPLEFVLDDQDTVFTYRNHNYQASFTYRRDARHTFGADARGFNTRQGRQEVATSRSQDVRYYSFKTYWIYSMNAAREWTVGLRYDDFRNRERMLSTPALESDYMFTTVQLYAGYYLPFSLHQALDLGVYVGDVREARKHLVVGTASSRYDYLEAKLRTGWGLFSADRANSLSLALSWNLDDLIEDTFDGGSVRFSTVF